MKDVDRAIAKLEPVVCCTKASVPYWGMQLNCFSELLIVKHELSQKPKDLERAVVVLCEIWDSENTKPSTRGYAAYGAAGLLVRKADWETATCMLEGAIEILPFTSPRHTPLDNKAFSLTYFRSLVSLAMAAALQVGRPLEKVVEIIEHGRGIIFGNHFQIQADIARVRAKNHQLAEQYKQIRDAIDAPDRSGSLMESSQRQEALHSKLQSVIEQILALGFADFPPGPTPATQLIKAAKLKPIIIVNSNSIRSDALVLNSSNRGVIPIRLPELRLSQVQEMAEKLRQKDLSQQQMFDLLKWLWDCIVRPIFTTSGILKSPENGGKPHIQWIPLGPLCALPIHATGNYLCESSLKQTALNCTFSSYIPSIKALLYSEDSQPHREADAENKNILLVPIEDTEGPARLPYTHKEINLLAGKLPANRIVVLHSQSSLEIRHTLRNSRIFHFAGHGFSHLKEPLQSSLLLNGQPLTVRDILTSTYIKPLHF
jgi:CHAT domain-containing protein